MALDTALGGAKRGRQCGDADVAVVFRKRFKQPQGKRHALDHVGFVVIRGCHVSGAAGIHQYNLADRLGH